MLATELGIWYTDDINADLVIWLHSSDPFPNVRVDMLKSRKSDNHILAGTHGRGLFLSTGAQLVSNRPSGSPEGILSVFPNPANDHITVRMAGKGELRAEIYNHTGQLVWESLQREREFRIPLDGLAAGSYIIRIKDRNTYYSETFIKKE